MRNTTKRRCLSHFFPQPAKAESRSSLATRLPQHETERVEKSRDAAAAHWRAHGTFAVNSRRTRNTRAKTGGCYGSIELEIGALTPAWRTIFLWKTEDRQKKEKDGQSKSLANHARLAPQFSGNMQC